MPLVADFLEQHHRALVEAFVREAGRFPSARSLSRSELTDTLPEYLSSLAALSREGHRGDPARAKTRQEETHLSLRLRLGYTLAEVQQEYVLVGQLITQLWEGLPPEAQPPPADTQRLLDELQEAMNHAVVVFSGYTQEDRQREKHFLRRLDALSSEAMGAEGPPSALGERLQPLLAVVREAMGVDGCALFLLDEEGRRLHLTASVGLGVEPAGGEETEVGAPSFVGQVAVAEEPLHLPDATHAPLEVGEALRTSGLRSLLGLRLWPMGRLSGVLTLGVRRTQPFDPRFRLYAETLADHLAGIIDRARLFERVRTTESRYRLATRALSDAIWDWDLRSNTVEWSEGIRRLLGLGEELEAGVESWTGRIHPEDRERVVTGIHAAIAGEGARWSDEYRFRHGEGGYIQVRDVGLMERDAGGRAVRMVGVMQDVTAQRQAEAAVRRSEARYRTLFDSIDEGFCIIELLFDAEGHPLDYRFLEANPAFERQTGLVDAVGRTMRELAPEHEQHWFDIYGRVALTGVPERFEQPARALGRYFDVYAFRTGEPHERRVAILFNDVSRRRQVEQDLRQRADFEKQLIGIVSHDLRQPLQAIRLSAGNLLRRHDLSEGVHVAASRIYSSADRMGRMLVDLLDFTQTRLGGGIALVRAPLDLGALAERVADEARLVHPERDVEVAVHGDVRGTWDGDRLSQVLTNLVANALAYSPEDTPVGVEVHGQEAEVVIRVRNAGAPIPAALLPRLFQPMERGEPLARNPRRSIGLGLYIVKHVVDAHGGQVEVHSSAEQGTVFTVRLPRS